MRLTRFWRTAQTTLPHWPQLDPRLLRWTRSALEGTRQRLPGAQDKIVVAMSGGVDSSVTALILSKLYPGQVTGLFMANWSQEKMTTTNSVCTVDDDWSSVRQVCEQLALPCSRVSFEHQYWTDVFEPMLAQYERGLTPNPDIDCNQYVKFGAMAQHIRLDQTDVVKTWLVTGHYTRILQSETTMTDGLYRAEYKPKDQSYYLTSMSNELLSKVLTPLGHYTKPEIREIARDFDLVTHSKRDSQGLCFVGQKGKFSDFLSQYLRPSPGNIVDREGKVWGQHQGLWQATIGQRSGISMPQGDPKYKGVWFVCDKNIAKNELVIAPKTQREQFYKRNVVVDPKEWYWMEKGLSWESLADMEGLNGQIRSLQEPNTVTSISVSSGATPDTQEEVNVCMEDEMFGVAPGQVLAIYQNDKLLGSGHISRAV